MRVECELDTIFILGIKRRSGTNWLSDLVCQHPECIANTIKEDYVMRHADHLIEYADQFYSSFPRLFRVKASKKALLYDSLGFGLLRYFHENMVNTSKSFRDLREAGVPARIVTKTPSVQNLEYFPKLFPNSRLLIIVRDGRDVVESNVKSFDFDYGSEMAEWANAAESILRSVEQMSASGYPHMLLKYEDLFRNTRAMVEEILEFLNLDAGTYDFSTIDDMPVRGSSELRKSGRLHWEPVGKSASFNPVGRWKKWPDDIVDEFDRVAGRHLHALGYA